MASPLRVQLILCDSAIADPASGKVHMLGAGWSVTGTPTAPQAVVVMLKVPWDRTNQKVRSRLQLLDSDANPVVLTTQTGDVAPIEVEHELEVGRPAGVAPGSLIDASWVVNLQPMPLDPGVYEWRLEFGDQTETASFQVILR